MRFGYAKLGEITAFVRDCVGDEPLLEIKAESIPQFNTNDRERLQKEWNRLGKESSNDYDAYAFSENEIFNLAKTFFERMQTEYGFPEGVAKSVFQFCENFYNEMKKEDGGGIAEFETRKYALLSINQAINLTQIPNYCEKHGITATQKAILRFLEKDFSYKSLFDELLRKTNLPSLNKYIEGLSLTFDNEKSGDEKSSSFRDTIEDATKKNKNPTWKRFSFILKYCPTELRNDFVFAYILNNIRNSLQEHFELTEDDFAKIKNDLNLFTKVGMKFLETIEEYVKNNLNIYSNAIKPISEFYNKTFVEFAYKKTGLQEYYRSLEEIEKIAPHASAFFVPWFKSFVCVAQEQYEAARNWFKKAFDNYQFAGDYLGKFLKMVFSFENYFTKWENVRKSISEEENKSPVNKYAKMYWNFGYAIGLFDKKADDVYLEAYKPVRNFYGYFPTKSFFDEVKVNERFDKEILSEEGLHFFDSDVNFAEVRKKPFEVLSKLKTSSQRNKLMPHSKVLGECKSEEEFQPRMYTPLALCMIWGSIDERLWDLADEWLDDTENPIDVDKLCFNGSTALHEALTQYSLMRLKSTKVTDKQKKLRAVTSKIIDKATYLGETKREVQLHTLQAAIHCYDVDFVKRIADKISDEDFQNYRISADEVSPLYYVLMRRDPLIRGVEKMEEIRKLPQNRFNYIWKNLPIPGFSEAEKKAYLEKEFDEKTDFGKIAKDFASAFYSSDYGIATKDAQLKVFDEIIDYFISRTQNVDLCRNKRGITALNYAAEFDDVSTCRKLIKAGADVAAEIKFDNHLMDKNIDEAILLSLAKHSRMSSNISDIVKTTNSFTFRCILYESWNTLRMFLTEFKDKAESVMHCGSFEVTPLVMFIIFMKLKMLEKSIEAQIPQMLELNRILKEFTQLFLAAGASMTESTEFGCAEYLLNHH